MVTQDEETTRYRYRGHLTNKKRYISTFTRLMTTKRSKVVTQDEGITLTKSRNTSITWFCDKQKKITSSLSQRLLTPNLEGWWLRMRGTYIQNHVTLWSCDQVTNKKYFISFLRRKAQELRRVVILSTQHVMWHLDHAVTWQLSSRIEYISSTSSWISLLKTERFLLIMATLKKCSLYTGSF